MYYENRSKSSCMHKSSLKDCKLGNMLVIRPPVFRWTFTLDSRSSIGLTPVLGTQLLRERPSCRRGDKLIRTPRNVCSPTDWLSNLYRSQPIIYTRACPEIFSLGQDILSSRLSCKLIYTSVDLEYLIHSTLIICFD